MFFKPVALLLALGCAATAQARTLTFAPLPMEQPEIVVKQVRPMLSYLEKHITADFRIEYSSDYADILKKFQAGKVDLAYLGPLPYAALREKYPQAVPVVHFVEKSGKSSYTCAIVVAGVKIPLSGLKGKKIALTQPLSTCGYLSTDGLLRQAGVTLEQNRYRYLDKHDEVALAVARGEFDAGGLKTAIGRKYAHMGLSIVAETPALPGFALIANSRTLDAATIEALRKALTALKPLDDKDDAALTQNWGENIKRGAVPASDADYDAVRKLRARADIPEEGNF
ncbi:MAG: PhnD/SsuA/transferrin family substrate-binding protein [Thiobacillus sp.]|nr:PhnD/SsuA/transferrin family substrate-binding protein [Thiobacillus sp.]